MSLKTLLICLLLSGFGQINAQQPKSYKLWYDKPAESFEESLVLGNGKLGASIYGGVEVDSILMNDITLWSGEPVDPYMNPDAYRFIPEIRETLKQENYKKAEELMKKVQGNFSQNYLPMGHLYFRYTRKKSSAYRRELNISTAEARVAYTEGGVRFTREYFVSHPDKALIIKLKSDKPRALNLTIDFASLLKIKTKAEGKSLAIYGSVPYHSKRVNGNSPDRIFFDDPNSRGTRFTTLIKVDETDGSVTASNGVLKLSQATEALIIITSATSFNGYDKDPFKEGLNERKLAEEQLQQAEKKDFKALRTSHRSDYKHFFDRLVFDLGGVDTKPNLPTDKRLKLYTEGREDKYLEELYVQFGRYLLIACSRTHAVPANLQGLWNRHMRPPWSSNYTININTQENYWMAETGNLSEMHRPLLTFLEGLSKTGEVTAKTFYGVHRGWCTAHNSDIWAMSNPVGNFGQGDPAWAGLSLAGAWLATHLWEHYIFTKDLDFLSNKGYPLMKGAAEFCIDWLVEDANGRLITSPSTSPENKYITDQGFQGATLYGSTFDLAVIREILTQTVQATEVLGIDIAFRYEMNLALNKLRPFQISKRDGKLQEWYHDWADAEPQHRHQSQLFGLYPGHQITTAEQPALAEACVKTLNIKGDRSTGWSQGWRINLWARLKDGNRAYKLFRNMLIYVPPPESKEKDSKHPAGGGTFPNLLDAHPPFQIDGNFGASAGVLEMLIQSTAQSIELLPALPEAWAEGRLQGVRARGGFELTFSWSKGKLVSGSIYTEKGGQTILLFNGKEHTIALKPGERKSFSEK